MKGIAIIAVVFGHFAPESRHFVYSFHMPLFFIVAGFCFKDRQVKTMIKSDFRRLILPFLIVSFILLVLGDIYAVIIKKETLVYATKIRVVRTIFTTGLSMWIHPVSSLYSNSGLMIWFLLALFWCRNIYNCLIKIFRLKWLIPVSFLMSAAAIYVDNNVIDLPFAILPGIGALFFFTLGVWIKKYKDIYQTQIGIISFVCIAIWILYLFNEEYPNLSMNENKYYIYPLDIFIALGGVSIVYYFCRFFLSTLPFVENILTFIGMNTMFILCVHNIDNSLTNGFSRGIPMGYTFAVTSILVYLITLLLCYRISYIREIFGVVGWKDSQNIIKRNRKKCAIVITHK